MTVEALPGTRGIAAGTFDDPSWLHVQRHVWLRSSRPWSVVPSVSSCLKRVPSRRRVSEV
jgi:hypothetical protein